MLIAGVAVLSASLTSLFLTPDREEPAGAQAQATSREPGNQQTVVLPNAPNEPAPPARVQPSPILEEGDRRVNRTTKLDESDDGDEPEAREEEPKPQRAPAAAEPRKPQRTVQRKPAPAPRPAPPRRRPPPQRTDEDAADWEVNLVTRVPTTKQNFEVGSNNAPILD